jgi:hypothetical protein
MITKELLSEVLGFSIYHFWLDGDYIVWREDGMSEINIYELVHKCKEWANKNSYWATSGYDEKYYCLLKDMPDNQWFYGDTEAEAIFKACQWILDKKGE